MKGKPWTLEEERRLRVLIQQGLSAKEIGLHMNKKPHCIYEKARRLGLPVGISRRRGQLQGLGGGCGSSVQPGGSAARDAHGGCGGFALSMDGSLPSVEEALRVLVSATNQVSVPGLSRDETLRLRTVISAVKTYKELLADFLDYRELEKRMVEYEGKYLELLAKTENV